MEILLLIIIGLLIWWILIRPAIFVRRQWRQMQDQARQFHEQYNRQQSRPSESHRRRRKKKIDPSVGEYVEFTETTDSATGGRSSDAGSGRTDVQPESQITDVTWEDLP